MVNDRPANWQERIGKEGLNQPGTSLLNGKVLKADSKEEWEKIKECSKTTGAPIIIDFHATWCDPCKKIAPKFKGLAEQHEGKMLFCKCDIDQNRELWNIVSQKYNRKHIPTFAIVKNDQFVDA